MRKIILDKNFFVFRDADGILGFTIKSYEGQPQNPRFLFDGGSQAFLLRRPGQVILLDALTDEFISVLEKAQKVRFWETPEDSSEIVEQYEVSVTKIEKIVLSEEQIVSEDDLLDPLPHSA